MIFFLFHIEIEGICGWIIGGGGRAKGMLPPTHTPGPPLPTPMQSSHVRAELASLKLYPFILNVFLCFSTMQFSVSALIPVDVIPVRTEGKATLTLKESSKIAAADIFSSSVFRRK